MVARTRRASTGRGAETRNAVALARAFASSSVESKYPMRLALTMLMVRVALLLLMMLMLLLLVVVLLLLPVLLLTLLLSLLSLLLLLVAVLLLVLALVLLVLLLLLVMLLTMSLLLVVLLLVVLLLRVLLLVPLALFVVLLGFDASALGLGRGIAFLPDFAFATILFWLMRHPALMPVPVVFVVGLWTDALLGAPMGLSIIAYLTVLYIASSLRPETSTLGFMGQWGVATLMILAFFACQWAFYSAFVLELAPPLQSLTAAISVL